MRLPFYASLLLPCVIACSEPASPESAVACDDTADVVLQEDSYQGPLDMAVVGDTLLYHSDASTLKAYAPGSSRPTVLVSPADNLIFGRFFVDGASLVLFTDDGLFRKPLAGGAATRITTRAESALLQGAEVEDATDIYGSSPGPDSIDYKSVSIFRQSLAGGTTTTLATIDVARAALWHQLFDMGESLWLVDALGEVFAVAKSDGHVTPLAARLPGAGRYFAPNGTTGILGTTPEGTLATFGLDGHETVIWPASAPSLIGLVSGRDRDGTVYVGGPVVHAGARDLGFAAVPPGRTPTLAHCLHDGGGSYFTALLPGDTVVYARVVTSNGSGVIRIAK